MYLENQAAAFDDFLAQNQSFWAEHGGAATGSGCLYVDLAHDNPAYLLTNLWLAKYVQRETGSRLVGLTGAWPKSLPHFHAGSVERLARSFLVDEVRNIDDDEFNDDELCAAFASSIQGKSGRPLREAVLAFAADVDPDIGWVLYDSWIRQERIATLENSSPEFLACARLVFRSRQGVQAVMAEHPVDGVIVGHYHYSPYAWMARDAVASGAPAYFQSLLLPVSVRRFADLADFRRGRSSDFVSSYQREIRAKLRDDQLETFRRRMFEIQGAVRQFFRVVERVNSSTPREVLLREFGLDPRLPVVCVYVPALCGPPHCFGRLDFDDNGDWLSVTLELAAMTPAVNFLVKPHPQDGTYDLSCLVGRLTDAYQSFPNIHFLEGDWSSDQLAGLTDLAATVSGTPGYELAARGIPTVAAGPSRYSDLGFSIDSRSRQDYADWLADPTRATLSDQSVRDALAFMFFEMSAGRSQSIFLPPLRLAGTEEFWRDGARRLRAGLPEEDQLWRNVCHMVQRGLPFLINVDVVSGGHMFESRRTPADVALGGLHANALLRQGVFDTEVRRAVDAAGQAEAALARCNVALAGLLSPGRAVRFGLGAAGNVLLGEGWSVLEEGGVWSDGPSAVIELPKLPAGSEVIVECYGYATANSQRVARFQCADGPQVRAVFFTGEGVRQVRIPSGRASDRAQLRIHIEDSAKPETGERQLGVWIQAIRIETADPMDELPKRSQ